MLSTIRLNEIKLIAKVTNTVLKLSLSLVVSPLFVFTILNLLSHEALGSDDIYRWVDKKGNYHFGSIPPEDAEAEAIKPTYTQPITTKSQDSDQPESNDDKTTNEYDKQLKKLRKQYETLCEKAKANKESMLKNHRITMINSDGESQVLSHEQKLEQLRKTDQQIQQYCEE